MDNDNILALINNTPELLMQSIAERVKQRRLERNWTQKLLASKAGIPLSTYRRFESNGEISLKGLIMLALSLGAEDDFKQLFSTKNYQSIDDLLESKENDQRKRATKNE